MHRSSFSGGLWNSPGEHFLEWWADLSRPSEWPACPHNDGLSVLVSVVGMKKKFQGDKSGEVAHVAILRYGVMTKILWRIMPHAATHCLVGGTTSLLHTAQGDDVEFPSVGAAVHFCRYLGLNFETELAGYSWFVCNTFSLGISRK